MRWIISNFFIWVKDYKVKQQEQINNQNNVLIDANGSSDKNP
jgi:hypothetical protein